jgi:hypothetical protein
MATILRNLPFSDRLSTVEVRGRPYRVLPNQVLVWVSLGRFGQPAFDPRTPRFAAILDTGFTDNFLIHEQHLRQFAGLEAEQLTRYREDLRAHGRRIPILMANIWLHRNRSGERDRFASTEPFLLELDRGIGVCGDPDLFPRLPLLGARALRRAQARLLIDYGKCRVSLQTPSRLWFLNWL